MSVVTSVTSLDAIFTERFHPEPCPAGPLSGVTIAVKDNIDVKGYHTRAGSKLLGERLVAKNPANNDASCVARLRAAGASLLGHTNMTELAYSGLGLNPHHGTPENPLFSGHIPGGSTSGGAVAVATGLADVALGTDTGGSLRIPAAFCGLVGFKPSQSSVPSSGCLPLSASLDCIGPMAKKVATCEQAWRVIANQPESTPVDVSTLRFVVPSNFGLDQLDDEVERDFYHAIETLRANGVLIEETPLAILEHYKKIPVWQFAAYESARFYQDYFDLDDTRLDPRVRRRIARAQTIDDATFRATQQQRQDWIESFEATQRQTILLLPSVACLPPRFDDVEQDADFDRLNLLCLRNTSLANVLDGCSLSLPIGKGCGLLLTAVNGMDETLLALGQQWESPLNPAHQE